MYRYNAVPTIDEPTDTGHVIAGSVVTEAMEKPPETFLRRLLHPNAGGQLMFVPLWLAALALAMLWRDHF